MAGGGGSVLTPSRGVESEDTHRFFLGKAIDPGGEAGQGKVDAPSVKSWPFLGFRGGEVGGSGGGGGVGRCSKQQAGM